MIEGCHWRLLKYAVYSIAGWVVAVVLEGTKRDNASQSQINTRAHVNGCRVQVARVLDPDRSLFQGRHFSTCYTPDLGRNTKVR